MSARTFALSLALLALAPAGASAADKTDAPPSAVVVQLDRARVSRAAPFTCRPGTHTLIFSELPPAADRFTLGAKASGGAVVEGVQVVPGTQATEPPKEVKKLEEQLLSARREQAQLQDEEGRLQREASMLDRLDQRLAHATSERLAGGGVQARQLRAQLDASLARHLEINARRATLAEASEKNAIALSRLERQLSALRSGKGPMGPPVAVSLTCANKKKIQVTLSYDVGGASWTPLYQLRAGDSGKASLHLAARVTQRTGEDWNGVTLTLSTAKGSDATQALPLANMGLQAYERSKERRVAQHQREAKQALAKGEAAAAPAGQVTQLGQSAVYPVPGKVTLGWTEGEQRLAVSELALKGALTFVTTPELDARVFQVLTASNSAAFPLPAGPLEIFRGPAFIGRGHLPYTAPGEQMELSLGVDGRFRVRREWTEALTQEPTFFSGRRRYTYGWKTVVSALSGPGAAVQVRERVPLSEIRELEIDLDPEGTSQGFKHDAERGFVDFELKVKPGAPAHSALRYHISVPKDWAS